jgi:hypothetical protein
MATALNLHPVESGAVLTGSERLRRFEAWNARLTTDRRDEMAQLIVLRMDTDMRLRVIRAALGELSGYALGHDMIDEGCDLIEADLRAEDARLIGGAA